METSRIDNIGRNGNEGEHYMTDDVTQPSHYMLMSGKLETIKLIEDRTRSLDDNIDEATGHMGYCYGNSIKYLMRWTIKDGVKDLRKCRQYIDMMIKDLI